MRLLRRLAQWLTSLVVPDVVFEGWVRERRHALTFVTDDGERFEMWARIPR